MHESERIAQPTPHALWVARRRAGVAAALAVCLLMVVVALAWGWPPPEGGWQLAAGHGLGGAVLQWVVAWDAQIDQAARTASRAMPGFTVAFAWLSHLGDRWVLGTLCATACCWAYWRGQRLRAVGVALAMSAQGVLVWALKHLSQRSRPAAGPNDAVWVVVNGSSLPSGHATAALVGLVLVAHLFSRPGHAGWRSPAVGVALVLAVGVGLSRVWLGAHHASDVLAGWCVGSVWLGLCLTAMHATTAFNQPGRE